MKPYYILYLYCIVHLQIMDAQNPIAPCGADYWRHKALEDTAVFHVYQNYEQDIFQVFQQKKGPVGTPENTKTVPVVVHIVHDGGPENVSDAQVQQALVWLNQALANQGFYDRGSGANVNIQLCLAQRTPEGLASNGITRNQSALTEMVLETQDLPLKDLNRWKPKDYINIWLVRSICSSNTGCGIYGYSFYPFSHGSAHDGIVMEATVVTAPEKVSGLAHELGHYLGLYHTFEGGCVNNDCLNDGDRICDTPPDQSTSAVPCDQLVSTCSTDTQSGPFGIDQPDMFWNFMDYGTPACFHDFTPDQSTRMNATLDGIRHSLLDSKGCLPPCPNPSIAAFTTSTTSAALGEVVHFISSSQNAAAYSWTLNGQPIGNQPNLDYTFWVEGTYIVQLTAQPTNPLLCEAGVAQITLQASCPATASFTVSNLAPEMDETIILINTSQNAAQTEWFVDGVSQGSVLDSLTLGAAGVYELSLVVGNGVCSDTATKVVYVQGPCVQKTFEVNVYPYYYDGTESSVTNLGNGNIIIASAGAKIISGVSHAGKFPIFTALKPDGEIIWSKTTGLDSTLLHSIIVRATPDGGFVSLYKTDNWSSDLDSSKYYLVKFTPDGAISWASILPGRYPNGILKLFLLVNPDGSIIISMPYLAKFSTNGDLIWAKKYAFEGLASYPDGGFLALLPNFVSRFDDMGNLIWCRLIEGTPGIEAKDAVAMPDGSIFVSGKILAPVTLGQGLMVRMNPEGETIWAKHYKQIPVSAYLFEAMTKAANGNITIAGYARADNPGPGNFYPYNLLLQIDLNGNIVWSRHRPEAFHVSDIASLQGGGYAVVSDEVRLLKTNPLGQTPGCPEEPHEITVLDFLLTNTLKNITIEDTATIISPVTLPCTDLNGFTTPLCAPVCQHTTEICNNLIDDDSDGLFDCLDPDCNCAEDVCAPKQGNLWYFGGKAGLDFNTDPPTVLTNGKTVNTITTTVSDPNGNLLFYADGFYVFNRFNDTMPNSFDKGDFAIPHPGDNSIYYLLKQNPTGTGYSYHTIDLKLENGNGDVVPGSPIPIIPASWGDVYWPALTKSCNPDGYWLTTRPWYNNTFRSVHIGASGVNPNPVASNAGQNTSTWSEIKFSPDGKRLAVGCGYPTKGVEVFDFDNATGKVSNPVFLPIQTADSNLPWAIEFSPSGRFVYLSTTGYNDPMTGSWNAPLFQFDLKYPGSAPYVVKNLKRPVHDLKLAPNGKIYGALGGFQFYFVLDVIHQPDGKNDACLYQEDGMPISTPLGAYFLPYTPPVDFFNFPQVHFSLNAPDTICSFGNTTYAYQVELPGCETDTVQWWLEGIQGQITPNGTTAQVQYFSPGAGRIIVTAQTTCGPTTDTLNVLVVPPLNKTLELGPDLIACENGVFTLNAGQGFARYQWSNGAEDSTTTTLLPGKYWVNVWDLCGNLQTDTITVSIAPNTVLDLGPDLPQQCPGFSATYQRPSFFDSWHWSPADYLSCVDCPAVTLSPGASAQWVVVAQTVHGCISVDTLSALIRDTLFFEKDTFVCAAQTLALYGSNLPPDTSAQFFLPANGMGCDTLWTIHVLGLENASSQLDTVICPNTHFVYQGIALPPDTLAYFHLPNVSHCDSVVTVQVGSYPFLSLTLPMDTTIGIGASVLLDAQVEGTGALNLAWSPTDALSCSDCTGPMANPLATVTYTLAVSDLNGCSVQGAVTVRINEECRIRVPNAFTPNGDGNNDLFRPVLDPCVHKVLVWKVINRWGQVVSEQINLAANDAALGWDGYFEGKQHPSDVLVWIATFEYYDGKQETKSGEVTLVR